ncbi:protein LNK1 [Gastrolobium bilobum]|uniref:protein LNK1 n=1 Tax=Gastrolobium bilobum TaxID=150636 RepID=UPI002AB21D84|nr:protein LNK1 [Gastrolobium bilobum]XP_061350383.1 protein LNK1 [Gastrolobium bilobum]
MLEKGSWSQNPGGLFSSHDSDSCKEPKRLTSDNTRMSDHCFKSSNEDYSGSELCADDTILGDKCVMENDNVSEYSINLISQTDNELSFLDNDGWLDIGNFEDIDRMLSCELTFGMGDLNNEEEFCWLSSSHGTEGSDDALKSEFKFPSAQASTLESISDYEIEPNENIEGLSINNCNKKAFPIDKKRRSQMDVGHDAVPVPLSTFSDLDMKFGNTDDSMPKQKIQGKLSKPSAGKRKNGYLKNGDSDHPYAQVEQYANLKESFGASSSGVTSQDSIHIHRPKMDSGSLGCIQIESPLMHPDNSHTSNYTSLLPTLSGSRSEHDGHPSPFKDSSYASNVENSYGHPLESADLQTNDKRENSYLCRDAQLLSRGFNSENMASPMPFHSLGPAQKVAPEFENENEGYGEVGGVSIGFSQEIDSSNVQEGSSMSSALDEISLEATSFRQLQQVTDQLDIRTKLCIRDSLYRLAKSAEQRHYDANASGQIGNDVEACKAITTEDANRCTGFMNMETNTNPIDRSIAHLLFHRPSDPLMLPLNDTTPFKSGPMIHGSVTNSPVMTEKQVCQEESSAGVEKKFSGVIMSSQK